MNAQLLKRELSYLLEDVRLSVGNGSAERASHRRKRRVIRELQQRYGVRVFVETGTYLGDMTAAMLPYFAQLHSIELGADLYAGACRRFAGSPQVHLYQGDSAEVLPRIVNELNEPALFWLDAHFSGGITARGTEDTPIARELAIIFGQRIPDHVILIDDARHFSGTNDYPSVEQLRGYVAAAAPQHTLDVDSDIIRLLPNRAEAQRA
jgi:hypothetical protein